MLEQTLETIRKSSRSLNTTTPEQINEVLFALANRAEENIAIILSENKKDLARMDRKDPKYDRLQLTEQRIRDIAKDLRNVASLPSPLNIILEKRNTENGLSLEKITVPLGVVGIIYEARPNVTFDVFSLCFKSGSACLLKGGSDAEFSNTKIVSLIQSVLQEFNLDPHIVALLPSDRKATDEMLTAVGYVDMIIPRGSQKLISYVREHAKVPVIETGAGIVHTYFDKDGEVTSGSSIIHNAKTRRVSVCNALDCLIIHAHRILDLPQLVRPLADQSVIIYADDDAYTVLQEKYPAKLLEKAKPEHFGTEFLDYKMAIKTVSSLDEALDHIAQFSSKHSEAIITENPETEALFLKSVDAAAVYANASTAFTDGAQFGLGAEIGISTQKLHARGPMALREITSYKWVIRGKGTVRN